MSDEKDEREVHRNVFVCDPDYAAEARAFFDIHNALAALRRHYRDAARIMEGKDAMTTPSLASHAQTIGSLSFELQRVREERDALNAVAKRMYTALDTIAWITDHGGSHPIDTLHDTARRAIECHPDDHWPRSEVEVVERLGEWRDAR